MTDITCIVCDKKHDPCPCGAEGTIHGARIEEGKLMRKWLCVACVYAWIQEAQTRK